MEKPLSPIFDDEGTEISREVYWGQKELGAALGTTARHVGELLRRVDLLQHEGKEPTAEALGDGAALYVTVDTADGPHRYARWRKDLVLDVLRHALQENPKPLTRGEQLARRSKPSPQRPQFLEERVGALERRVLSLERRLKRMSP